MKRLILPGLLGCSALLSAQSVKENEIQIDMGDKTVALQLHEGDRIVFTDEHLTFLSASEMPPQVFLLKDLQLVRFATGKPDGIDMVLGPDGKHNAIFENGTGRLILEGFSDKEATLSIYDLNGRLCLHRKGIRDTSLIIPELPDGIYIVRVNNHAFKCQKK